MQTPCVTGGVEGHREGITHNLKDISIMRLNRLIQNLMMPRQKSGHFARMFLCEFGAAFDIGEEESDSAGGESHSTSPPLFSMPSPTPHQAATFVHLQKRTRKPRRQGLYVRALRRCHNNA